MGPVEVIVFEFPQAGLSSGVASLLYDLVSSGHVRIADALLVTRDESGDIVITDLDDTIAPEWSSISSDPQPLLSAEDATLAATDLAPGASALLIVVEHLWPTALGDRTVDSGGAIRLHARIDPAVVAVAAQYDA